MSYLLYKHNSPTLSNIEYRSIAKKYLNRHGVVRKYAYILYFILLHIPTVKPV